MEEVSQFSKGVARHSGIFSVMDESFVSRITVLQNDERFIDRWIPAYSDTS